MSQCLPVDLQWGHWYWRYGHLFLRWLSRSRRNTCTSFLFSMHSLVQRRRVYPHNVVRWSSRDCKSPTQPHPFLLLLHLTLSALISRSPVHGESMSGRLLSSTYMASQSVFVMKEFILFMMLLLMVSMHEQHMFTCTCLCTSVSE